MSTSFSRRQESGDQANRCNSRRACWSHLQPTCVAAVGLLATSSLMVLLAAAAQLFPHTAAAQQAPGEAARPAKLDPAEVLRKIEALAASDETVPDAERPANWLRARRNQIVPQLIAALNDKNPIVAEQCLKILAQVPTSKQLTAALIAKASDDESPLRYRALQQLEKSADDPRVVPLLRAASLQAERFPDPRARARWAWLAGNRVQAVEILKPFVTNADGHTYTAEAIRLLGEIGAPSSVALLEPIATGDYWGLAVEARSALAKIDPVNHALTKDQAALLKDWRWGKADAQQFRQHMKDLSGLNAVEIRPLLFQMLRDKDPYLAGQTAALAILAASKDKEALPEIRCVLSGPRSFRSGQAVEALLSIDDGPQSRAEALALLKKDDPLDVNWSVLQGIAAAAMPVDIQLSMLLEARQRLARPFELSRLLLSEMYQQRDVAELLVPLMDKEIDLLCLGGYCEAAALDKQRRFGPQIRRAMKLLASDPTVAAGGKRAISENRWAAQTILDSVATYGLNDLAPDIRQLKNSKDPAVRGAAQAAAARLGVAGATGELNAELGADEVSLRAQAAKALLLIKPADETERAASEEAVLSYLGKPAEDFALRVLVTCGGAKTVQALEPILDDPDVRRAVYAGWVLAQLSDAAAADRGLRRVAIFALFHRQLYQQGAGIDFPIAPDLEFHRTTVDRNQRQYDAPGKAPGHIPKALLTPFDWNDAKQQFAIRCYQQSQPFRTMVSIDFLSADFAGSFTPRDLNRAHLSLLKEIVAHDSRLERLMVQGKPVPHFKSRQWAAKAIAAITEERATYLGLAGESLDSNAFPAPYPNQDQLLATFIVDHIQKYQLTDKPRNDLDWTSFSRFAVMAKRLDEQFNAPVLVAIREEAARRNIDITNFFPMNGR